MIGIASDRHIERSYECDVLVIGAGLYGCATAYNLAHIGADTLVVDRHEIGSEASAATSGNLHLQLSPASHAAGGAAWMAQFARQLPFFQQSVAFWHTLVRDLADDLELNITGGLMVAETPSQMQALIEKGKHERAHGLDVELLGAEELRRTAPYLAAGLIGASWCPAEGMANPLTAVRALAHGAQGNGARFLEHTTVQALAGEAGGWEAITNQGKIRCQRLVIAAGHASADVANMLGVSLPVTHRPIHVSVSEPAARFIQHLVYHTDLRMTLKQVANGNIMLGGGWSAEIDSRQDRPVVLRDSIAKSVWVGQHVVPAIGNLHVIRTWAGRNVYTPDYAPIIGPLPNRPGVYLAVCSTYGFTQGPLCGLLAAEAVTGRSTTKAMADLSVGRFGGGAT